MGLSLDDVSRPTAGDAGSRSAPRRALRRPRPARRAGRDRRARRRSTARQGRARPRRDGRDAPHRLVGRGVAPYTVVVAIGRHRGCHRGSGAQSCSHWAGATRVPSRPAVPRRNPSSSATAPHVRPAPPRSRRRRRFRLSVRSRSLHDLARARCRSRRGLRRPGRFDSRRPERQRRPGRASVDEPTADSSGAATTQFQTAKDARRATSKPTTTAHRLPGSGRRTDPCHSRSCAQPPPCRGSP